MKVLLVTGLIITMFILATPSVYAEFGTFTKCVNTGHFGDPPADEPYNLQYHGQVDVDGKRFEIQYDGQISNIIANTEKKSLEMDADSECVALRLPRTLIDSTQTSADGKFTYVTPFTVLVNGNVSNDVIENLGSSADERVLRIDNISTTISPQHPSKIEIIGTTIAPEFGSFALLMISISLVGVFILRIVLGKYLRIYDR